MPLPTLILLFLASLPAALPRDRAPLERLCATSVAWAARSHSFVGLPCQPDALAPGPQEGNDQGSFDRAEAADNETEEEGLEDWVGCLSGPG